VGKKDVLLTNFYTGCSTPFYKKGDGLTACAFFLDEMLEFTEAQEKCKKMGGRLPEIKSKEENDIIAKFKVYQMERFLTIHVIHFFF